MLALALLALVPSMGLISSRSRSTAEPSSASTTPEPEPAPSPLVAPRPPASDATSRAALDAGESVLEAEDAERAADAARPASDKPPALALARLEIRVARAGHAAPWAWVELGHVAAGATAGTVVVRRTDEAGRLTLELAPGSARAVAWSGHATAPPGELELEPAAALTLDLELVPAQRVAGRVIDALSGAPLAGATISFWTFAESDAVTTGADGGFEHPRFPSGAPAQQIHARRTGYGQGVRYLRIASDGRWKLPAARADEDSFTGTGLPWVELALVPEQRLRGRVLDPRGAPLAGVEVSAEGFFHALPSVASRDEGRTTSDAHGRFELAGLRSDVGHALSLVSPGCARRTLELEARAGALELGDVQLAAESVLAGVVIDGDGIPVAGVEVVLTALERDAPEPRGPLDVPVRLAGFELRARTSPDGTFVFEHLEPRAVRLGIETEHGTALEEELQPRADGSFADPCLVLLPRAKRSDGAEFSTASADLRAGE